MSSDARPLADGTPNNDAINVTFSSVADRNNGESSSRTESRDSGRRSQGSGRERKHRDRKSAKMTPPGSDGKRSSDRVEGGSGGGGEGAGSGHRIRKSGGFLLDSVLSNGSPPGPSTLRGKRKAHDSPLHIEKRRPASNRLSGDSSMRGSPLSNELSFDGAADAEDDQQRRTSRTQTMDPAELVQMALNLSESRKRHVSNTLQVPLPTGRRVSSANYSTVRSASSGSRRPSRMNDDVGQQSPSSDQSSKQPDGALPINMSQDNVLYTFSPATLARAEKARKYFELASEYRRALDHLPPLKPNADAPGNFTFQSKSSPGSAFPDITRVATKTDEKHDLGRRYNPIQCLRNRRVRIRERRPFTAPPDTWSDPDKVAQWIDGVETSTEHESYRAAGDEVELPQYAGEDESLAAVQPGSKGHRRTDTTGSIITRPENSWTIEPMELLADLYWTEKGDNKYYIETRHGNPIFTQPPRKSMDTPKISVEMHRDQNNGDADGMTGSETDEAPKHDRRRKLVLPLHRKATKPEKRKHRRMLSRASSVSSDDSMASAKARRLREARSSLDHDIAPLERHMQDLIAKDARGELSSPEIVSPDHWDARQMQFNKARPSIDRVQRDSIDRPNGRNSLEVPRHDHRRSKSADGRMGSLDKGVSSASILDSEPTTPVGYGSSPGLDFLPPYNKRGSEGGQGSKLPVFRSQSKERRGVEQTDFAEPVGSNLYTIMSAESNRPRSSMESARPHMFSRHRTNDSVDKSMQRVDTDSTNASIKEGVSTVGRFLKGRRDRIGGLVSERFRGRDRAETLGTHEATRGASDVSDMEDGKPVNGQLKKRMTEPSSAEISPRGSIDRGRSKPKFHVSGLPSFTSSTARDKPGQGETFNKHIGRQQQEQREAGRSERFDRLAPPKINVANASDTEEEPPGPARIKWAKGYGDLDSRGTSASRGTNTAIDGPGTAMRQRQRHWSIYDQALALTQPTQIRHRDIARVRALLLASGIKAREIQRRANGPRAEPPHFLLDAAAIAGETLANPLPPMKEEHLLATRLLSTHLTAAFTAFERSIAAFQTQTAKTLSTSTLNLHSKASEHLSKLVHETSDEADAFTVELTTRGPQNTKQVLDAVEEIVRRRRRQWRLVVNVAFKLLEWLLLGIMWGIWFGVVMFNLVKRGVVGVGRGLRWLVVF